jgi:putative ABC transport system permease protein
MRLAVVTALIWLGIFSILSAEPEILVNRLLAERLQIRPGDVVELAESGDMQSAVQFRVVAIYDEQADPFTVPLKRSLVKMHLPDLENLTGKKDQLDIVSIKIRNGTDAGALAERLNAEAIGFTAFSAEELSRRTSSTFEVVSRFHEAIAFITMMAGAIFIFALVVMRVEDQRKNLAILTVTGISRKTILKSLVLESLFFAFFASLLGAILGFVSAKLVNLYYQNYYQTTLIFAEVTPQVLTKAMILSFALGIVSGTFSWFRLRHLPVLQELGR